MCSTPAIPTRTPPSRNDTPTAADGVTPFEFPVLLPARAEPPAARLRPWRRQGDAGSLEFGRGLQRASTAGPTRRAAALRAVRTGCARSRSMSAVSSLPSDERGRAHEPPEELDVRAHADDLVLRQRVAHPGDRGLARVAPCTMSLAIIGIVERRDLVALAHAGVDAHVGRRAPASTRCRSLPIDGRKSRAGSSA